MVSLRPDDPFAGSHLAGDLAALRATLDASLRVAPSSLWSAPTERAPGAWTLHQTLAHVTAVAAMFQAGVEATLAGQPFVCAGLARRADLHRWNAEAIERLGRRSPDDLRQELLELLARTERAAATAGDEELGRLVHVVSYNRPMPLGRLIANQIIHPGIIHGAQLTSVAGAPPLWAAASPALMRRNLARLVELLSVAYFPERGGALDAAINYRVGGAGGGVWHVRVAPDGGYAGPGPHRDPALTLWFRSPDIFCRIITQQLSPVGAALTGRTFAWGNLRLALTMGRYFLP